MVDLTDLPRMIMPAALVELLQTGLSDITPPKDATDDRVAARISGPGGGAWHIGVREGAFELVEGPCERPLVMMSLSVADWREFVAGRVRDALVTAVGSQRLSLDAITELQGSADRANALSALSGDIRVVIEDDEEDAEYCATVTFGGDSPRPATPTTTVRLNLNYLGKLASGGETLQGAFFAGKIAIEGDINLAVNVMTALL